MKLKFRLTDYWDHTTSYNTYTGERCIHTINDEVFISPWSTSPHKVNLTFEDKENNKAFKSSFFFNFSNCVSRKENREAAEELISKYIYTPKNLIDENEVTKMKESLKSLRKLINDAWVKKIEDIDLPF